MLDQAQTASQLTHLFKLTSSALLWTAFHTILAILNHLFSTPSLVRLMSLFTWLPQVYISNLHYEGSFCICYLSLANASALMVKQWAPVTKNILTQDQSLHKQQACSSPSSTSSLLDWYISKYQLQLNNNYYATVIHTRQLIACTVPKKSLVTTWVRCSSK